MAYTTIYTSEEEKKKKEQEAQATPAQSAVQAKPNSTAVTPQKATASTNPYKQYEYDPQTNQAYLDALAALQGVQGNKPTYSATYDDDLHALYDQIVNREKFRYDAASDPLWNQYINQYTTKGRMAMMDTMGEAAALTGGYGSSYGQMVGQQAYQGYLQEANQNLPQFYQMALDAYTREGDALQQQYAMIGDMRDTEYGRYMDALNQHWNEVQYHQGLADTAYDRGYNSFYTSQEMGYGRQQDAYAKLESLIMNTGYVPSAAELEAAGMSAAQAKAMKSYYDRMIAAGSGGSGGGGGSGKSNSGETPYTSKGFDSTNQKIAKAVSQTGTKGSVTGNLYATLDSALNSGKISAYEYNSLLAQYEPKAVAEDNARQNNGKPAVDVATHVTVLKRKGAPKSEINNYLDYAVKAGVITQKEANKLRA